MAGPKTGGPRAAAPAPTPQAGGSSFAISSGRITAPQRVVLYGAGGIGKTTLAALAPKPIILDIEEGSRELDAQRVDGIGDFATLLEVLRSDLLDDFSTVVIDSATKAEEFAVAHTLDTIPHPDKGHKVDSVEGYGYGKGYSFVYDTFLLLLQELDAQVRKGRNVLLIAHDCVESVPNPLGDDWIRYEPHLQRPKSGKGSVRNRVVQWADHVFFLAYDVISEEGKARGAGTRTIFPSELPTHIAKSRLLADPMNFESADDGSVWAALFGGAA
jgi:hypothetical protein